MNFVKVPLDDEDSMFVNPEHVVSIIPSEHAGYSLFTLVNDEVGWLVPLSAEELMAALTQKVTLN